MKVHILLNLCGIENQMGNDEESDRYYKMAEQDAIESENEELILLVNTYK